MENEESSTDEVPLIGSDDAAEGVQRLPSAIEPTLLEAQFGVSAGGVDAPLVYIGKIGETKTVARLAHAPDTCVVCTPPAAAPTMMEKFRGLVPEKYSAKYTERCFQGSRFVETTRADGAAGTVTTHALKRFLLMAASVVTTSGEDEHQS